MRLGVLIALLSYSIYSISDALIKSVGSDTLSAFEITFIVNLFALGAVPFARGKDENWGDIFRFRRPWLMHARAFLQTTAAICFIVALTRIPFAETYSIVFLAPLFLTLLSVVILKERVEVTRWLLIAASFAGVLIVVRPGFTELGVGHLAAVACAFAAAAGNLLLRMISTSERHTSILALTGLYQVVMAGGLMLVTGFVVPDLYQLLLLAIAGGLAGAAALLIVRAMQLAPASQVGPAIYVQILWAVVLGAVFYNETKDAMGYAGLALIVVAGVATVFADGLHARITGRWTEYRAQRESEKSTP